MRVLPALLAAACLGLSAQSLTDRFKESGRGWETLLEKGDGASVRKAAEALIARDGAAVSPADYNEMRTLVALYDIAARACILNGAWEDAVGLLQKAVGTSVSNQDQADQTFSRIRKDHEQKMSEWRDRIDSEEKRLKELDASPGLPEQAIREQRRLKASIEEHRAAIAHSEKSLREIQTLLAQIRNVREVYEKSLAEWTTFLAKEREDLSQAGTPAKYVAEKLEQVKTDDAKPRSERLAYGRRLLRLDPANADCQKFVNSLMGIEPEPEPKKEAVKKPVAKRKKK
jgi:hypothetical protein